MSEADELRRHIRMLEDVLMERLDCIESHVAGLASQFDELVESVDGMTAISKLLAARTEPTRRRASIHIVPASNGSGDDAACGDLRSPPNGGAGGPDAF